MSTAYHPETDGLTERTNGTLQQYLKTCVNNTRDNWDTYLPMAEFALNSAYQESIKNSPFFLTYGEQPRLPIDMLAQGVDDSVPAVKELLDNLKGALENARGNIVAAQQAQKKHADKHRRSHMFKSGDIVLLDTRNLKLKGSTKLRNRYIGPFKLLRQIGENNFEIDLPTSFKIHRVFHVSLIKPYHQREGEEEVQDAEDIGSEEILNEDTLEFEVEKILEERKVKDNHGRKQRQFLIKWKNYPDKDNTWEDEGNCGNAKTTIKNFWQHQTMKNQKAMWKITYQ